MGDEAKPVVLYDTRGSKDFICKIVRVGRNNFRVLENGILNSGECQLGRKSLELFGVLTREKEDKQI